jgi:hypothetical protein
MTRTEYRNKVIDAVMYINECFREEAVEMVSRMEHIIDNNYACDSQVSPITEDDIYDTAREIVYYS